MSRDPRNEGGPGEGQGAPSNPFGTLIEQMEQSWTASLGMWSAMTSSWQSMLQNRGVPAVQAMMNQIADPGAWPGGLAPLAQELQNILALPRFADLPALSPGELPSFGPAVELMAVAQQYMLAAAPVWAQACQRFQTTIAERRQNGTAALASAGEAMDVWNNVLDQTLMEFNRSAEFAKVQQRFLQAAMRQRREVRKLGERIAQTVDMPTRTELDDIYHRLHDLLREVHGLRRELRAMKRSTAERPKETALAPKRSQS